MKHSWVEYTVVALLLFLAGLASTWPLAAHLFDAIPCKFSASTIFHNKTGDNLQLLYWFWLLRDNLFGSSSLLHNPYEFNIAAGTAPDDLYMYPLYFPALLFAPLGDIAAYNCLVLLSYVLTGLFTYLLLRIYAIDRYGALLGALAYTLAPVRIINLTGGHLNGFIFYLIPATLYSLELCLRRRSLLFSALCGLCIFWLSLLEVHLIYYLIILMAAYLPLRLLPLLPRHPEPTAPDCARSLPCRRSLLYLWLAGLGATACFLALNTGPPAMDGPVLSVLLLYPLLFALLALLSADALSLLFDADRNLTLWWCARTLLPCALLGLCFFMQSSAVQPYSPVLYAVVVALVLHSARRHWRGVRPRRTLGLPVPAARLRRAALLLFPACLGLLAATVWMLLVKRIFFSGSIAGAGRTIEEVAQFSPTFDEMLFPGSEVYLGIVPLVLILTALADLFRRAAAPGPRPPAGSGELLLSFHGFAFLLSFLLGTGLALGAHSLYYPFFDHFPFFSFARVPDRIMTVAFLFGAVLCGYGLTVLNSVWRKHRLGFLRPLVFSALATLLAYDFGVHHPTGLTFLDKEQQAYDYVRRHLGDQLLLELPIWPGDNHQSSLYEYHITKDRIPRVNGYTPLVSAAYQQSVYGRLMPLNRGMLDADTHAVLTGMGVGFLTVHESPEVFPSSLARQSPRTTVRYLMRSPYLEYLPLEEKTPSPGKASPRHGPFLFRVRDTAEIARVDGAADTPAGRPDIFPAAEMHHLTGARVVDPLIKREVLLARPGRDSSHFLTYGPYLHYPAGRYDVRFRLRTGKAARNEPVARIETTAYVAHAEQRIMAEDVIYPGSLRNDRYLDVALGFSLERMQRLEFRTFYLGGGELWLEKILVRRQRPGPPHAAGRSTAVQPGTPDLYAACDLPGDTGLLLRDAQTASGWAVQLLSQRDMPGPALYGPFVSYPRGRYRVTLYVRGDALPRSEAADEPVLALRIPSDVGNGVLAERKVFRRELDQSRYTPIVLAFETSRTCELDVEALYPGRADILVDRLEVEQLP